MSIISAYGMPSITALELASMLASLGITFGVVNKGRIEKHKGTWPTQVVFPVIFTSATTFLQTYPKFKKSRVIAFVLDNPFTLEKELGLPLKGVEIQSSTRVVEVEFGMAGLKTILGTDVFLNEELEFSRSVWNPVKEVMSRYAASDLGKLQTFLYRIKDVEKRNKVSRAVKLWLTGNKPLVSLEREVGKLMDSKTWNSLKTLLTSPTIETLRGAINRVKDKPNAVNRIAKELKLSPFDINYLMATK